MAVERHVGSERKAISNEVLSQVMDGEVDVASVVLACHAWRDDAPSREAWRSYHIIGDALRSGDLCCHAGRDAAFLEKLKVRLDAEPAIVAPSAVAPSRRRAGRMWSASVAALAGVVVVGGVVVMTATSTPASNPEPVIAKVAPQPAVPALASLTQPSATVPPPSPKAVEAAVETGPVLRDARLDRYLAAHREFGGSTALGVPAEFVRDVVVVTTPNR